MLHAALEHVCHRLEALPFPQTQSVVTSPRRSNRTTSGERRSFTHPVWMRWKTLWQKQPEERPDGIARPEGVAVRYT